MRERVLKPNGYILSVTIGEATDKYGVTEIKSGERIIDYLKIKNFNK